MICSFLIKIWKESRDARTFYARPPCWHGKQSNTIENVMRGHLMQAWKIIKDDRKCYARPPHAGMENNQRRQKMLCAASLYCPTHKPFEGDIFFGLWDCLCLSSAWENHVRTCGNKLNILLPFKSPVNLNTNIYFLLTSVMFVPLGPITML